MTNEERRKWIEGLSDNERRLFTLLEFNNHLTMIAIKGDDSHTLRYNIQANRRRRIEIAHTDDDVKIRSPFMGVR